MSPTEQETMVKILRRADLIRKYKETYGKDWMVVYEEDKANDCLMKVE